jgi:hypothetical protein
MIESSSEFPARLQIGVAESLPDHGLVMAQMTSRRTQGHGSMAQARLSASTTP